MNNAKEKAWKEYSQEADKDGRWYGDPEAISQIAFNAGWEAAMNQTKQALSNQGLSQAYLGEDDD